VTNNTEDNSIYFTPSIQRYYDTQLKEMVDQPDITTVIEAALSGETEFSQLHIENNNLATGIVPIRHPDNPNSMIGAIVWRAELNPWEIIQFRDFSQKILIALGITTLFSAVLGTIFGIFSSRNLVGRLSNLSSVINEWSHGNFASKITDEETDELNQVAVDLNQMSGHIETLLLEKQEMSIIRERNRLARDLHDSVKQETFAASAQLAAARSLIRSKPDAAEGHLNEANLILDRVRTELTSLIHELYPTLLENRNLAESIRAFASDWEGIYNIKPNIEIVGYRGLPKAVEKTFYLILQEALSNVARHSHATEVDIYLKQNPLNVFMMVSDNGCGMATDRKSLGIGMKSMNERARLMGGTLDMASSPAEGTCIRIEIPLDGNDGS
jgi:NarL family two-component system sensor histidine kinase LiaS